ncbi:MAG: cytochrome b [Roseiarcus sp.]
MSSSSSARAGSYSAALRSLHWAIAALILLAIAIGVVAIYLPRGELRGELLVFHKSLGVTALALAIARILVRLVECAPAYVPPLGALNRAAAHIVHFALYVLMIAMPVSGYVHSMAGKHDFSWFGLIPVPNFIAPDKAVEAAAGRAHYVLALVIGALLVGHVGAAIWHARIKRDLVLTRMWPGWRPAGAKPESAPRSAGHSAA